MFVHISPEIDAIGETISTLKFAERVSTVELGAARVNKESNEVRELKEQVVHSLIFRHSFFQKKKVLFFSIYRIFLPLFYYVR